MGKLEKENQVRVRKANIQKAVLKTIAAAGFLGVALLAPNALQILAPFIKDKRNTRFRINRSVERLKEVGLVKYEKKEDGFVLRLTPEGEAKLLLLEARDFSFSRPKKWDKKWRIIIFDIKEYRKVTRNKLRLTLSQIGFVRLQNSVWVYPYDCEDLITLLKADFKIGKDVLYIIADSIENDSFLRKIFGFQNTQ